MLHYKLESWFKFTWFEVKWYTRWVSWCLQRHSEIYWVENLSICSPTTLQYHETSTIHRIWWHWHWSCARDLQKWWWLHEIVTLLGKWSWLQVTLLAKIFHKWRNLTQVISLVKVMSLEVTGRWPRYLMQVT